MWWISFEETGDFRDIPHLFHFLELLVVFFAKIPDPDNVSHITFPQWAGDSWKGKDGQVYNEWILKRMYPGVVFGPRDEEDDEKVIIDRANFDCGSINKTWCKYIRMFDPYLWARTLNIPRNPNPMPVVTYVNRQDASVRSLTGHVHDNFVKDMLAITDIQFVDIKMENISFDAQFTLANITDLLIGVHGNGLSHAAFMQPHRNVVEIFTPGWPFHWDYYTLSKMMGHEYLCIFNDSVCVPRMFVRNKGITCTQSLRVPTEPIHAIIDQIKEEKGIY